MEIVTISSRHLPVARDMTQCFQFLIVGGADVTPRTSQGETSLYIAAQQGYTGVMESLLRVGQLALDNPCGPDNVTPLIAAAVNDQLASVKLLIKAGPMFQSFLI